MPNTFFSSLLGLGKTFIAAVVMYNYYMWYPKGKIIFMAPTKPLVAQQIENCINIMGIPASDTAEMTGNDSECRVTVLIHSVGCNQLFFPKYISLLCKTLA